MVMVAKDDIIGQEELTYDETEHVRCADDPLLTRQNNIRHSVSEKKRELQLWHQVDFFPARDILVQEELTINACPPLMNEINVLPSPNEWNKIRIEREGQREENSNCTTTALPYYK